jgi:GGDEF domain-containing protein
MLSGPFRCGSDHVPESYLSFADARGVSRDKAVALFHEATRLRSPKDPITGFDGPADRLENLSRAMGAALRGESALCVEVDLHNLGGLNDVLGNSVADSVYRHMSSVSQAALAELARRKGATLCSTRHGGDEFSFVVVSASKLSEADASGAMAKARETIARYARRFDVASELRRLGIEPSESAPPCLAKLPHPKHKVCVRTSLVMDFSL